MHLLNSNYRKIKSEFQDTCNQVRSEFGSDLDRIGLKEESSLGSFYRKNCYKAITEPAPTLGVACLSRINLLENKLKALLPSVLAKTGAPQNRLREFNKANDILAQRKQALEASRAFGLAVGITYLNELGKNLLRMELGQEAEESTD